MSVAGDADGIIWAAANNPDYILKVDLGKNQTTQAVGTGTSGYNGNIDPNTGTLASGAEVQVNAPHSLSVALTAMSSSPTREPPHPRLLNSRTP